MTDHSVRTMLVTHPSPDLYGSDRQLLVTIDALHEAGWNAVTVLPRTGPLVPLLEERGGEVVIEDFPVLRKSLLTVRGMLALGVHSIRAIPRLRGLATRHRADAILVNTVTIPIWIAVARSLRLPVVCHVHEAEEAQAMVVRRGMASPLLLCHVVIANSGAAKRALTTALPRLGPTVQVVHNGVPAPESLPSDLPVRRPEQPMRVALVGRLSPRKGIDVALDALAILRAAGRDVTMTVCGTAFDGYEWYEDELRARAAKSDLAGHVTLAGYVSPTWPVLEASDVVLVPSRVEPFGNAAVEGLWAHRPVIASATQGLNEVIRAGETGLLVPPGDPEALARALAEVMDDPNLAVRLARAGQEDARERFSEASYRRCVAHALAGI